MSKQTPVGLEFEGEELEGVLVSRRDGQARPTVMLIPTVMGVSDLELGFAKQLVELGYNAFVADISGKKFRGAERDVMFGEMTRLGNDRVALRRRLLAIVDQVRGLPPSRGASWSDGDCPGSALDVARTGTDIAQLSPSTACSTRRTGRPRRPTRRSSPSTAGTIPMAPPDHVVALGKELTEARPTGRSTPSAMCATSYQSQVPGSGSTGAL